MKLKTYRILYTAGLTLSTIISLIGAIFAIYSGVQGLHNESDNFILALAFIVLLIGKRISLYSST